MKTTLTRLGMALVLAAVLPAWADVPLNNLWPNPTFEAGENLDTPEGTLTAWGRGGGEPAICQVSTANAVSGTHALAVVDTSGGYGEWYADLALPATVTPDDSVDLQWYQLYDIGAGSEMRVTVIFFDAANAAGLVKHYVVNGQSPGWAGTLAASPFVKRNERLVVPPGATRLQVALVSGGPTEGQGTMLIDDFSVVHLPKPQLLAGNFWPNPTFEEGANLDTPEGNLTGWNRGGNEPAICQVSPKSTSPSHGLAVVDTSGGYGEWYADAALGGQAVAGDELDLQWFEVFDVAANNETRLTLVFLNASGGGISDRHFVAHGQSAGWTGDLASSPFVKRNDKIAVPEGAVTLRFALVSGGPAEGHGTMIVDDLSVAKVVAPVEGLLPGNFWPNPLFEEGQDLNNPTQGTLLNWSRGGNDTAICTISTAAARSPQHSVALDDQNPDGYGVWLSDYPLSGLVREGRLLNLQWFEMYSVASGEMRLTIGFLDAQGNYLNAEHVVVKDLSSGWSGDPATSTFTQRNRSVAIPPGTKTFRIELVSGGPSATTGFYLVDNMSIALAPSAPEVLFGNLWLNPGFEEGTDLDNPTGSKPLNWNRGGADTGICQLTQENYTSSTHALALVDNGNSYGEWYADLALGQQAKPGDSLSVQWFELFKLSEVGEMRLTALFFNAAGDVVFDRHWVAKGQSVGWGGDLPNSSFTKRLETLTVPNGATRLRLALVSGGPGETTGLMVIDDVSVAAPPRPPEVLAGSFWRNPGFEEGAQLDLPENAQVSAWNRGGSASTIDQLLAVNFRSTSHALALADTRDDAYGEWYRDHDLTGLLQPGDSLQAQWWWIYDTTGDMRLTFNFFDSTGNRLGGKDYVVSGQSDGWTGSLASSPFVRRVARLLVPEGTVRMSANFASGGSASVTGTVLLDDLSVRVAPANADTDGDGMADTAEDVAETDAEDPASVLQMVSVTPDPAGFQVVWASVPGKAYAIESASTVDGEFVLVPGGDYLPASGSEPTTSFADTRPGLPARTFYKVKVLE